MDLLEPQHQSNTNPEKPGPGNKQPSPPDLASQPRMGTSNLDKGRNDRVTTGPATSPAPVGQPAENKAATNTGPNPPGPQPGPAGNTQEKQVNIQVAERPQLAPNVELSGEMQESGFEEKQWLVLRDSKFIQVTELLYKVAEQANGQQTLEEMAAKVSENYSKKVSADNVRQLLEKKLIPMGLVTQADGTVYGAEGGENGRGHTHGRTAGQASPLQINLKMAKIPPKYIDPGTTVFQHLYHAYVIIPVMILAILAHIWLFFVHGVAHATSDLLYNPGLLLGLIALIIVSAAFHEFGHAAALKFAGGKVRGMGVGLYIIYPAFYTDVTENYRLKRWARVRTDLGGFYFNLIIMLVIMGVYVLTGWEFLLGAIVLMDLEIFHQLLPFVRLDGYWALADITGMPDFFSQIGPFLRTVLPLPFWKGRKLPDLKTWVKIVFALYILVTIPLLFFLIFMIITGLPRILATAWDSLSKQAEIFGNALGQSDFMTMLGSGGQILLLAIPTGGTLFVIFTLGRTLFRFLWNWSKPTPKRRVAGSLMGLGIVGLLAFMWTPQLPFSAHDTPGPLYRTARQNFVPIKPTDRGLIYEAIPFMAASPATPAVVPATMTPSASVSPAATSVTPVSGTPGLTATAIAGTPTVSGTTIPAVTATPAGTPTVAATATVAPTATPVPVNNGGSSTGPAPAPAPAPTAAPVPPASTPTPAPPPPTVTATPAPTATATPSGVVTTPATAAVLSAGTPVVSVTPTPTP